MIRWLIPMLTVGLLAAAEAPKKEDVRADQQNLQGTWRAVLVERDSKPMPAADIKTAQVVISKDRLALKGLAGSELMKPYRMRLDPTRMPRGIDLTPSNFTAKEDVRHGIYQQEGKALKICLGEPGKDRPRAFTTAPGSGRMLLILEREPR